MKALVKFNKEEKSTCIQQVKEPEIGSEDVLVEVAYTGICGSDTEIFFNNVDDISYNVNVPLILGHEFSGTIVDVGSRVTDFSTGDKVVAETHAEYCGKCLLCQNNNYHVCRERSGFGFGVDGAFAEYVKVPRRILHKIPENISLPEAALAEPLCVSYSVVSEKAPISPGDSVMVIGPGSIGLLCCKLAKIKGASNVIVVGTSGDNDRLKKALQFGADHSINNTTENPFDLANDFNEGYGFDIVIDAAGPPSTLSLALESVRPCGHIIKVAWGPEPLNYCIDKIIEKDITLRGSFSHNWTTWNKSLELLANQQIDVKKLISAEMNLTDWQKAFEMVRDKKAIKALLKP